MIAEAIRPGQVETERRFVMMKAMTGSAGPNPLIEFFQNDRVIQELEIDAGANTASITTDGATYPVSEAPPDAGGRRLETSPDTPAAVLLTPRQMVEHHQHRRKLNAFGSSLMTSGSFTTMSSSGVRRLAEDDTREGRKLNAFSGSLMTSSSFTMMSGGGIA